MGDYNLTLDKPESLSPNAHRLDKNDKGLLPMRSLSKPDCVCHGFSQVLAVVQSLSESLQKDNANKTIASSVCVCIVQYNSTTYALHICRKRERERRGGARVYSTEYVCNCLYTYDVQYVVVDHSPFIRKWPLFAEYEVIVAKLLQTER